MPLIIGFFSSIIAFLSKYLSSTVLKVTVYLFFGGVIITFIFAFFTFSINLLATIWSYFDLLLTTAQSIAGSTDSVLGVSMAFLDSAGVIDALNNCFDFGFLVISLIFLQRLYLIVKRVYTSFFQIINGILSSI